MADAWPMIAACKAAQWRGMDHSEQITCAYSWDDGTFPAESWSSGTPIWTSESCGRWLTLMSVKLG
jgi:hypothetical protein